VREDNIKDSLSDHTPIQQLNSTAPSMQLLCSITFTLSPQDDVMQTLC